MKAAAAVLGASLLFFIGVLTGAGRREAVPPPAAIPLGAVNTAAPGTSGATSPAEAPKRSTTTTAASVPAPTTPSNTVATTGTPATTAPTSATAPTAPTAPSSTSTTRSGDVEQVDNQVDCRSQRNQGKGKREPCPSTTTSTGEAPGDGRNR